MTDEDMQLRSGLDLNDYVRWEYPPQQLHICIHSAVVRALSATSLRCLKAKSASEIGGLLWGYRLSAGENGSPNSVLIDKYELIASEGPLFNTTPADQRSLAMAVLKARGRRDPLSLVGYFRSHVRNDLCLSPEDEELVTEYMADPRQICLLIRPFEIGVCMAGLFFWQDGRLQTDASDLEVPFLAAGESPNTHQTEMPALRVDESQSQAIVDAQDEPEMGKTTFSSTPPSHDARSFDDDLLVSRRQQPAPVPERVRLDTPSPEHRQSAEPVPKPQIPQTSPVPQAPVAKERPVVKERSSWLLPALIVLILMAFLGSAGVLGFLFLQSHLKANRGSAGKEKEIGLQVVRAADGQLNLSWNRQMAALAKAEGAKLTINDNQIHRILTLDPVQLRNGRLTYFPSSADVEFRLEIYLDKQHSQGESVRLISPDAPQNTAHSKATSSPGIGGSALHRAGTSAISRNKPVPEGSGGQEPNSSASFKVPPLKAVPRSAPSGTIQQPAPVVDSPVGGGQTPSPLLLFSPALSAPPAPQRLQQTPPPAAQRVPPAQDSLRPSQPSEVVVPITAKTTSAREGNAALSLGFVAPRPIRRVMPDTRMLSAVASDHPGQIKVQIRIDEEGNVLDASPVDNGKGAHSLLTKAAVEAARQWSFSPATLRGKPIPTDHTIIFYFRTQF